jgi:hypothetical protein
MIHDIGLSVPEEQGLDKSPALGEITRHPAPMAQAAFQPAFSHP